MNVSLGISVARFNEMVVYTEKIESRPALPFADPTEKNTFRWPNGETGKPGLSLTGVARCRSQLFASFGVYDEKLQYLR